MTQPTLDPILAAAAANVALNMRVAIIDKAVQETPDPVSQMGILMLSQALCFRRIMGRNGITNRTAKRALLKRCLADFENKITAFGFQDGMTHAEMAASQFRDTESK